MINDTLKVIFEKLLANSHAATIMTVILILFSYWYFVISPYEEQIQNQIVNIEIIKKDQVEFKESMENRLKEIERKSEINTSIIQQSSGKIDVILQAVRNL